MRASEGRHIARYVDSVRQVELHGLRLAYRAAVPRAADRGMVAARASRTARPAATGGSERTGRVPVPGHGLREASAERARTLVASHISSGPWSGFADAGPARRAGRRMSQFGDESAYLLQDPGQRGQFRPFRRAGDEMFASFPLMIRYLVVLAFGYAAACPAECDQRGRGPIALVCGCCWRRMGVGQVPPSKYRRLRFVRG